MVRGRAASVPVQAAAELAPPSGVCSPEQSAPAKIEEVAVSSTVAPTAPAKKPAAAVSGVINIHVRQARMEAFELWLSEINASVSSFPGFLYRDIVRSTPRDGAVPTSILLVFEDSAMLRQWETSQERAAHLQRAHELDLWDFQEDAGVKIETLDISQPVPWSGWNSSGAPPLKPPPPPKWKLALIIWVCVTTSVTAWTAAGATPAMLATDWISFEVALLLCIAVVVVVIIYAYSELLIALPLGNLSLALWLKQPPIVIAVHSGHGCSNCLRVAASGVCSCLNVGCGCFNPPPPAPLPASLLRRLNRAEGRLDALR